jgi:xylulokinase
MSALNCGVNIGSTNVTVTLVDECGHAVWTKAVPTPRIPDDKSVATDALRLVAMIEEMIVEGWRMHGRSLPLRAIAAVGVGEDGVGGRADLTPTGLALLWFDERATAQAKDLQRNFLLRCAGWTRDHVFSRARSLQDLSKKQDIVFC